MIRALIPLLSTALSCAGGKASEPRAADLAEEEPVTRHTEAGAEAEADGPAPSETFSPTTTRFSLRFHGALAEDDANVAVSGPSAQLALSMVAAGAAGETAGELAALFDTELGDPWWVDQARATAARKATLGIELTVANGVWVQEGFPIREAYTGLLRTHFDVTPVHQDFRQGEVAADAINAWVKAHTREKIDELVDAGDVRGAKLVLANAIAFKGRWAQPFDEDGTVQGEFRAPSGPVTVPMMTGRRERVSYVDGEGYTAIALPYEGNGAAMILVLPDEGGSLGDVEARLDATELHRATVSERRTVNVLLPKWKAELKYDLIPALREMGLRTAFSGGDFSGITARELLISKAVQKVFVEVDEEGTEAAAATGIVMRTTSAGPPPVDFHADRPFFWAIWHTATKTPLFTGRLVDPS